MSPKTNLFGKSCTNASLTRIGHIPILPPARVRGQGKGRRRGRDPFRTNLGRFAAGRRKISEAEAGNCGKMFASCVRLSGAVIATKFVAISALPTHTIKRVMFRRKMAVIEYLMQVSRDERFTATPHLP